MRTGVAVASKQAAYRSAQADGTVGAGDSSKQAADTVDRFCEEETPFKFLGLCSACGAVPVFVSPNRLHEL